MEKATKWSLETVKNALIGRVDEIFMRHFEAASLEVNNDRLHLKVAHRKLFTDNDQGSAIHIFRPALWAEQPAKTHILYDLYLPKEWAAHVRPHTDSAIRYRVRRSRGNGVTVLRNGDYASIKELARLAQLLHPRYSVPLTGKTAGNKALQFIRLMTGTVRKRFGSIAP